MLTDADLDAALTDDAPSVRRRAAMIAGQRPSVSLRAALDDPNVTVAEAAAWGGGEQEDSGTTSQALKIRRQLRCDVPKHARALGAIGAPRGRQPSSTAVLTNKLCVRA